MLSTPFGGFETPLVVDPTRADIPYPLSKKMRIDDQRTRRFPRAAAAAAVALESLGSRKFRPAWLFERRLAALAANSLSMVWLAA